MVSGCAATATWTSCARERSAAGQCVRDGRDRASELDVMRLQVPHPAGQSHGQVVISDGHQQALTFDARDARDRLGQSRRFTQRSDAEYCGGPAVQHDPVDVPRGEKVPPAPLSLVRAPARR